SRGESNRDGPEVSLHPCSSRCAPPTTPRRDAHRAAPDGAGSAARSPPGQESSSVSPNRQPEEPRAPRSGRLEAATLDLAAVACRQQHERLRITCLRGLPRAGMGAFGAVVLGRGVDAVALFELALL